MRWPFQFLGYGYASCGRCNSSNTASVISVISVISVEAAARLPSPSISGVRVDAPARDIRPDAVVRRHDHAIRQAHFLQVKRLAHKNTQFPGKYQRPRRRKLLAWRPAHG
jgi:hypothetical protein